MGASMLFASSLPAFSQERVFLYEEQVGGPYVDEWYVSPDSISDGSGIFKLKLERQGKSGHFEAAILVDCGSGKHQFDPGIRFGTEVVSLTETEETVPDAVISATYQKYCGVAHASGSVLLSSAVDKFYAYWSDPIANYGKEPNFPVITETILIEQNKSNTSEKFDLFQKSGYTNFELAKRQDFSLFVSVRDNRPDLCLPFDDETGKPSDVIPNSVILIPELNSVSEIDFQYSCQGLQSDDIILHWLDGEKWPLIDLVYGYPYGVSKYLYKFNPTKNMYEQVLEYTF